MTQRSVPKCSRATARSWWTSGLRGAHPVARLAPTIEDLARTYGQTARIGKLNVDENPISPSTYGISSIPAVLVFKAGKEVDRIVGLQPRTRYERALNQASGGD